MDVDARIQVFDLRKKYQFLTSPGVDRYNMPLYSVQSSSLQAPIAPMPVYQGFMGPVFVNGFQVPFYTQRSEFNNIWPNYVQTQVQTATGNGTAGPYTLNLPFLPNTPNTINFPLTSGIIRGHIDTTGIIAIYNQTGIVQDPPIVTSINNFISTVPVTSVSSAVYFTSIAADGSNIVVADSGLFLQGNTNYGLLMQPGNAPNGNLPLTGGPLPNYSTTQNTINYLTGVATNVYFPQALPAGMPINASCIFFETGIPRSCLFYDNVITLRAPPNTQYVVEIDAYLSPAAFLNSADAMPFGYMAEYIARGAARKILSDTGDTEQFMFYEPLFKEQETLVWKRSQRQNTSTRTQTIYSGAPLGGYGISGGYGTT